MNDQNAKHRRPLIGLRRERPNIVRSTQSIKYGLDEGAEVSVPRMGGQPLRCDETVFNIDKYKISFYNKNKIVLKAPMPLRIGWERKEQPDELNVHLMKKPRPLCRGCDRAKYKVSNVLNGHWAREVTTSVS